MGAQSAPLTGQPSQRGQWDPAVSGTGGPTRRATSATTGDSPESRRRTFFAAARVGRGRDSPSGDQIDDGLRRSNGNIVPRRSTALARAKTAGVERYVDAGGRRVWAELGIGATGLGRAHGWVRWARTDVLSTNPSSFNLDGQRGHGEELIGGGRFGHGKCGDYGDGSARGRGGENGDCSPGPAGVLKWARGSSSLPESSPESRWLKVEDGLVGLAAASPSSDESVQPT